LKNLYGVIKIVIRLEKKKVLKDGFNDIEYDERRQISMETAQEIVELVKEELEMKDEEEVVALTPPNEVFTVESGKD